MVRVIDREFNFVKVKVVRNVRISFLQHFNSFCLLIIIYKVSVRVFNPDFSYRHFDLVFIRECHGWLSICGHHTRCSAIQSLIGSDGITWCNFNAVR